MSSSFYRHDRQDKDEKYMGEEDDQRNTTIDDYVVGTATLVRWTFWEVEVVLG